MARRGRFDLRSVFALKLPPAAAWPAALLTIAGGWLFAIVLSIAQNHVMPFPSDLIERFAQFFGELNSWPVLGVVAIIGLLPGVCEELLCRGFILHSFLPRFGKTGAVVITALAFGLLHLDPYRFVGTAFLGLLLGYIVISTGSIYPAMLAHATNNALSYLVQRTGSRRCAAWLAECGIDRMAAVVGGAGRRRRHSGRTCVVEAYRGTSGGGGADRNSAAGGGGRGVMLIGNAADG